MWTCSSHCIYPLYYHLNQEPPATKLVFNIAECLQSAHLTTTQQSVWNTPLCLFKVSQFLISSCENENKTRITTCLQSVWEKYFYKELSLAFKAKCVYCWQRRVNVFVLSSCLVDQDCYAKRLYGLGLNTDDWVVHYQFHSLGSTDPQLTILSQILC